MLEYYRKSGFTMHNDSGHKKYTLYYKNQNMKSVIASFYSTDMTLGYKFETSPDVFIPARYADGKAAAELNFGDIQEKTVD